MAFFISLIGFGYLGFVYHNRERKPRLFDITTKISSVIILISTGLFSFFLIEFFEKTNAVSGVVLFFIFLILWPLSAYLGGYMSRDKGLEGLIGVVLVFFVLFVYQVNTPDNTGASGLAGMARFMGFIIIIILAILYSLIHLAGARSRNKSTSSNEPEGISYFNIKK